MKISGLQKTSLIDYPGNIVSIIFTQGCNFKCPYCHNPSLISSENKENSYLKLEDLFNFFKKRAHLIDGISLTGGEPTLQSDLIEVIKDLKQLNFKIKLDTNGTKPNIIKKLIELKLINYIAMDVKAPLKNYEDVSGRKNLTEAVSSSIKLILDKDIDYEFRTTVVPGLHGKKEIIEIGKDINGARKYVLQNFRPHKTYNPEYENLCSFPPSKLKEFKILIKPHVEKVLIRE